MDKLKVENEMATRISVDTIAATKSLSAFRSSISAATNAWKANETALKNSGQYAEAAKARISGLNEVIELQKAKISELKSRQEGLNLSNKDQLETWLKLDKDISQASKQLASYEVQVNRANSTLKYQTSGLAELQTSFRRAQESSRAYANSLEANGNKIAADRERLSGLRSSLENLSKQHAIQRKELNELAQTEGKLSEAYRKQKVRYDETSASMGRMKTQAKELSASLNPPKTTAWMYIRNNILKVDEAEKRVLNTGSRMKEFFRSGFAGIMTANALPMITNQLHQIVVNGTAAAKVGAAMEARWKNIGVSSNGIKQLTAQVGELKTNTNLSAQAVNALQTRFYGMTHSISQTKTLTQGVASLSDQLKLSDKQSEAFAGGLNRIYSSGKVTSSALGRLEKQAPGLSSALAKASGMTRKEFNDLVASGKMTSDQFNNILTNASKNYAKNAKAFGQSSGGALHRLQAEWASTQAKLAKPLLKVSATGLNELDKALNNKETQKGLEDLAKGFANVAVFAAKTIGVLAKHQGIVKTLGATILTLVTTLKLAQAGLVAFRIATTTALGPIGLAITAIVGISTALVQLYKHNKKFRNFINGIAKFAKSGLKKVGSFFKNTFKQISKSQEQSNREQAKANKQAEKNWRNFTNSLSRNWKSYWRNRDKEQRQNEKRNQQYWNNVRKSASSGWKNMESSARAGVNKVSRWYSNMNRSTSRVIQNMYRQHPKTFQSMYKIIQDRTKVWHDLVTGHWSQLKDDTGRLAKDQSRANKDIFEDMYSAINKKTGGWLGKVVDSWKDHMSQIGDAISNGKKKAGAAMADLANGVLKPFKTLIDDIQSGINWVLDKIGASKLGGSWSAAIPTFATGTAGNPDGLKKSTIGMVNDGAGSHWRELYSYKGQIGAFPNKRNFITFLPKGMSILNGEDSHKFMSAIGLPRFANGVGSFFDSLEKGAADAGDFIDKVIEHPVQALEDVFKKFIKVSTPIKFATNLITSVPAYVAKQAGNWIKKQFEELADPGGSGVERWRPYVIKALAMLHLSSSLVGKVLRQIQTESGGNPKAMGGTDGLADGHAMGLMQVKPGTFAANKLPGHGNIWNGFDNLLAGLNYARKRYGDSLSFLGQGHGYANGGRIDTEQFIRIAEQNKPEYVIPTDINKRSRAYQLLGEVIARFRGEEPNAQPTRDDQSISRKEFMSLESKLDQLISGVQQLVQVGHQQIDATVNSGNKFGMKANRLSAYTTMAKDQRLNDFMSYKR
ncbi:tape measure protein [Limosilactobacillus reuteri]|uniref:tape measure protein n=1 Tax=Limosilactobacillus reuteri TaxID=1598 RepID=UPI0015FCA7DB|nr:tape measure protein [Limosilactobacillus reuteri]MBB1072362.1 tape measure protein [Limosilactobacillus reuteri]MCC4511588.1 tape measure protein [Limosilactobacillus reuteri]MCC4513469.1 tape measure protein [Limosilactobacillus reuteri]MCC4515692.1 tape measure protein [Limosilactobacillus reuteri]